MDLSNWTVQPDWAAGTASQFGQNKNSGMIRREYLSVDTTCKSNPPVDMLSCSKSAKADSLIELKVSFLKTPKPGCSCSSNGLHSAARTAHSLSLCFMCVWVDALYLAALWPAGATRSWPESMTQQDEKQSGSTVTRGNGMSLRSKTQFTPPASMDHVLFCCNSTLH